MSTNAKDLNYPLNRIEIELGITHHQNDQKVQVTAAIRGNGYQKLDPGAAMTVNGHELIEHPLTQDGVWYKTEIDFSGKVDFKLSTLPQKTMISTVIDNLTLDCQLPDVINLKKNLEISCPRFSGQNIGPYVSFEESPKKWKTLKAKIEFQKIIVDQIELQKLKAKNYKLTVGIIEKTKLPQFAVSNMTSTWKLVQVLSAKE